MCHGDGNCQCAVWSYGFPVLQSWSFTARHCRNLLISNNEALGKSTSVKVQVSFSSYLVSVIFLRKWFWSSHQHLKDFPVLQMKAEIC